MSSDGAPYEVGRGRPPESTRFRKGVSGNPKGRPRKSMTKAEIIARVRDEPISVRVGDKTSAMTFFEACIRKVHHTVMSSGRIADLERLIRLYEKHGVAPEQEQLEEARERGEEVVRRIMEYFDRTVEDPPEGIPGAESPERS